MTHDDLVQIAARWLRGPQRCGVVMTDAGGGGLEIPDAIGFRRAGRYSIVVECKASRGDFLRDRKKFHRQAGMGLGQRRYYLAPVGIVLTADEVPAGWGLVEVNSAGRCRVVVKLPALAAYDPDIQPRATGVLYSAARKAQSLALATVEEAPQGGTTP